MAKDYYDILGVKKTASAEEVKRAYRKLAHEHHPDKGGDTERFKQINEAYQILSDPQKKAQYDQFGSVGGNGFGSQGFNEDLFRQGGFYGSSGFGNFGDIFETFFGAAFSQVQVEINVGLTTALLGDTIRFTSPAKEEIELKIPPTTQDGQAFKFKGKGNPYKGGRGDLIVVVRVDYPKRLTKEQKDIIKKLQDTGL